MGGFSQKLSIYLHLILVNKVTMLRQFWLQQHWLFLVRTLHNYSLSQVIYLWVKIQLPVASKIFGHSKRKWSISKEKSIRWHPINLPFYWDGNPQKIRNELTFPLHVWLSEGKQDQIQDNCFERWSRPGFENLRLL